MSGRWDTRRVPVPPLQFNLAERPIPPGLFQSSPLPSTPAYSSTPPDVDRPEPRVGGSGTWPGRDKDQHPGDPDGISSRKAGISVLESVPPSLRTPQRKDEGRSKGLVEPLPLALTRTQSCRGRSSPTTFLPPRRDQSQPLLVGPVPPEV